MTQSISPPPLEIPQAFSKDPTQRAFFSALLDTIYKIWVALYGIRYSASVSTTDATRTDIARITVPENKTFMIEACIVARRIGGSAGSDGDSAFYKLIGAYKNIGGTLTGIGTATLFGGEDQAAWNVNFSSDLQYALVQVNGAANNNINWSGTIYVYQV